MKLIFDSKNYKAFLNHYLKQASVDSKGVKSSLSQAVGCQTSYLSQVLHAEAHFSLEQGEKLALYLELNAQETEYLFLMIQFARAGSSSLKQYFSKKMDEIINKRMILKDRLKVKEELTQEDQSIYFSTWIYSAIHVLLTIPQYRKLKEISKRLRLSNDITKNALDFLMSIGLVSEKNGEYLPTKKSMHLGYDASMINRHHANWRLQVLKTLDSKPQTPSDLIYSSVVSVSKEDALKIRELLVRKIEETKSVIKESPEEELFGFNLDFYSL